MDFTPRLIQILFILLHASKPITASDLADQLQINKRTIFRELDHVDGQLARYGLNLNRKSGVGYVLEGTEENKKNMLSLLEVSDHFDPRNREERQQKLIFSMMNTDCQQKLFYYANELQVSVTTISKDLEVVEKWFQMHGIKVQKQGGIGISLQYKEEDFRKAFLAYINKYKDDSFIKKERKEQILLKAEKVDKNIINWLTGNSAENFILYTAIAIQRMLQGKFIREYHEIKKIHNQEYYDFIEKLSDVLEKEWEITIGGNDRYDLYIFLRGCRLQYAFGEEETIYIDGKIIDMRDMVYEMANVFDPIFAYTLKNDEEFIKGMEAHLMPTVIRLFHHISIKNPMLNQVKVTYADIYEKAAKSAKVMEKLLNVQVPEDEIGYLALHFGGAMMRTAHLGRKRHIVQIGVVCSNGIGISILLSSKLRHHFENKIEVTTLSTRDVKETSVDFIVSTFPVETEIENICVAPMLDEDDLQKISKLVEKYAFMKPKKPLNQKTNDNVYEAMLITNEINSIIKDFAFRKLDNMITFDEAIKEISTFFTEDKEKIAVIYQDFTKRETLSTQVIEEFEIVFLHAKTQAVDQSKFLIVLPEGEYFQNAYFKKAKAMIVMLIPENDLRKTLAISAISGKIFEEEEFLKQIKEGKEKIVFEKIRETLENYLNEYLISVYRK